MVSIRKLAAAVAAVGLASACVGGPGSAGSSTLR